MLVILISDNYPGPSPNWSTSLYNTNIHVFSYKHGVYIKLKSFSKFHPYHNPYDGLRMLRFKSPLLLCIYFSYYFHILEDMVF